MHIYEDTPAGRESLLQTAYFCRVLDSAPVVHVPRTQRFLLYLENRVTQVDLAFFTEDEKAGKTALGHASEILAESGLDARFLAPAHWTTPSLPDLPADFAFMACPLPFQGSLSVYSDLGMRRLPREAPFSVFMPSCVFKPWKSIALFHHGAGRRPGKSLILGRRMAEKTRMPMDIFCFGRKEEQGQEFLDFIENGSRYFRHVRFVEKKTGESEAWMQVPHDALVLLDALRGSWFRNRFFPSFQKKTRTWLQNPMLFVGDRATLVPSF